MEQKVLGNKNICSIEGVAEGGIRCWMTYFWVPPVWVYKHGFGSVSNRGKLFFIIGDLCQLGA